MDSPTTLPRVPRLHIPAADLLLGVSALRDYCGRAMTHHCLGIGTGTFGDPVTFAAASNGPFKKCEVIYIPYLRKYARFEDVCDQCSASPLLFHTPQSLFSKSIKVYHCVIADSRSERDFNANRKVHIDIWTGSSTSNGGHALDLCENKLTTDGQPIERNPESNLKVDGRCKLVLTCALNAPARSQTDA